MCTLIQTNCYRHNVRDTLSVLVSWVARYRCWVAQFSVLIVTVYRNGLLIFSFLEEIHSEVMSEMLFFQTLVQCVFLML